MIHSHRRRYVIIGFDGLRPDMVRPDLVPNLHEFTHGHTHFGEHRCTFPSETYVNTASLLTGCYPSDHGLVANVFSAQVDGKMEWFKGFDVSSIEQLNHAAAGNLFSVASAGEILGRAGRTMAVICTNSGGSARLMHHQIDRYGHLNLCPYSVQTSTPRDRAAAIFAACQVPTQIGCPDFDGVTCAADILLDQLIPEGLPDLTLLWFGEPDNSCHKAGIGSPENKAALKHADAQLGRVLDWWSDTGRSAGVQLLVMSDHGHVTISRKVSVSEYLRTNGFIIGTRLDDGIDAAMLPEMTTHLMVRNHDPGLIKAISQCLMKADWIGSLFRKEAGGNDEDLPGLFTMHSVMADHHRSPDLSWTFQTEHLPNAFGFPGTISHSIDLPLGGGIHGGLSEPEMRCLLAAGGTCFKAGYVSAVPSCITDILPTVLSGLTMQPSPDMTGRILNEGFVDNQDQIPVVSMEMLETELGEYCQFLQRAWVDGRCYLLAGGRKAAS